MKHPILLCTLAVSLGLAGTSVVIAQTASPALNPVDSTAAAASPTPVGTIAPIESHVTTAKPRASAASPKILEKYDANKNGQIDPEEKGAMKKDRTTRRADRLKKYDKNGDGKLDDTEKAILKADLQADKKANKGL